MPVESRWWLTAAALAVGWGCDPPLAQLAPPLVLVATSFDDGPPSPTAPMALHFSAALDEDGVHRVFSGRQTGRGDPAEILAEHVAVSDPELELGGVLAPGGFLPGDLSEHRAAGGLHLDQRARPEVAHAPGGQVAHQAQDHGQGEGQHGPGEPHEGVASPEVFGQAAHQMDS